MGTACLCHSGEQEKPPQAPPTADGYRIGAGDVLQIVVWREPDASSEALVRVDGKISVPLVGDVDAVGLTPTELKDTLVEKFSHYINSPSVSVYTKQINSRKIYVLGNVKKEGPVPLLRPMTVLQALNEAGGLGEWAVKKKIYVLRKIDGKQVKMPFDYSAVIKGKRLEQNAVLLPDDTIVVP
jgi:polysaccharide export outer membrane protein